MLCSFTDVVQMENVRFYIKYGVEQPMDEYWFVGGGVVCVAGVQGSKPAHPKYGVDLLTNAD